MNFEEFRVSLAGRRPDQMAFVGLGNPYRGAGLVVFIDAARFGGRPGEIVWVDEDRIDSASVSTHAFSLRAVTDFLRLHRPFVFKVLAIQSGATGFGAALSPAVRLGVETFFFPS